MQLAKQPDDIILAWSIISKVFQRIFPDLRDCAPPVHHSDNPIGYWRESIMPATGMVLEDIPQFTTEMVTMYLPMSPYSGFQIGDLVP